MKPPRIRSFVEKYRYSLRAWLHNSMSLLPYRKLKIPVQVIVFHQVGTRPRSKVDHLLLFGHDANSPRRWTDSMSYLEWMMMKEQDKISIQCVFDGDFISDQTLFPYHYCNIWRRGLNHGRCHIVKWCQLSDFKANSMCGRSFDSTRLSSLRRRTSKTVICPVHSSSNISLPFFAVYTHMYQEVSVMDTALMLSG